jgi:hypothetical protein
MQQLLFAFPRCGLLPTAPGGTRTLIRAGVRGLQARFRVEAAPLDVTSQMRKLRRYDP